MNQALQNIEALSDAEKLCWLQLARTENVGPITFYRLVERYGSAGKAFEDIGREYAALQKLGGEIVTAACAHYPLALGATADDILEIIRTFSGSTLREPIHVQPSFSTELPSGHANDDDVPENAQETILDQLSFTAVSVDELLRSCHLTIPVMQTVLLELELAGRIKRDPGGRVSLFADD